MKIENGENEMAYQAGGSENNRSDNVAAKMWRKSAKRASAIIMKISIIINGEYLAYHQ
jgi:hypothetical protein